MIKFFDYKVIKIIFKQLIYDVSGVGVGMILDTSSLMMGQYFKRRREMLEIFVVASRGVGVSLLYTFVRNAIRYLIFRTSLNCSLKGCLSAKPTDSLHIIKGRL